MFALACVVPAEQVPTDNVVARSAGLAEALTPLRKQDLRVEDRAAWRKVLGWTDDCEQAFEISYAGKGVGIEFHALRDGMTLVAVLCAAGAYQPSFMYYLLDESSPNAVASLLNFPTYESPDGRFLIHARHVELWGEPSLLHNERELTVLSLARQTGDCGTWARYGFTRREVELREFWARLPCPAEIEPPADPKPGEPPEGWRRVDDD
jgi:hypothetical protein